MIAAVSCSQVHCGCALISNSKPEKMWNKQCFRGCLSGEKKKQKKKKERNFEADQQAEREEVSTISH